MSALQTHRVVRVFYRDYVNEVSICSSAPESLLAERVAPLADRLLVSVDNFLGVVDRHDTILQCYLGDDHDEVVLELVVSEQPGCLRQTLPRAQALERLADLPERFDVSLLPDALHFE
jgi:hypothetical protein